MATRGPRPKPKAQYHASRARTHIKHAVAVARFKPPYSHSDPARLGLRSQGDHGVDRSAGRKPFRTNFPHEGHPRLMPCKLRPEDEEG